ncbi:phage holin family protein [Singulisphaera sp. PoT]|uniref:phage holin family protein n=1 Tax=Singulisphaera sp. PoT TaxID=3411797 RepID=UPI003BF47E07
MDNQATMNGSQKDGQDEGVVGNITGFANDVATLCELQAKLISLDAKDCATRIAIPFGTMVGAVVAIMGAVPVVLFGIGYLVAEAFKLSNGLALVIVGITTIVLGAIIAAVSAKLASKSTASFRRSREELSRNFLWVKTVLTYSGRPASRRRF